MKRIGIIGTRRAVDAETFGNELREAFRRLGIVFDPATCHVNYMVVTGDATGVDALAVAFARDHGMLYVVFHAEPAWRTMGNKAGPIRTRAVVDYCDVLIAMPDAKSVGTLRGIERARARMIPYVERQISQAAGETQNDTR